MPCVNLPFGDLGNKQLCVGTFTPFRGIASGGLYSTLAYVFNFMFIILFIVWIVLIASAVLDYIKSEGDTDIIEEGQNKLMNIWKGISVGIISFVMVSLVGVFIGAGSPMDWPKSFAQCANTIGNGSNMPDRRIYMNVVNDMMDASNIQNLKQGQNMDIYCCSMTGWRLSNTQNERCKLFESIPVQ